MPEADIWLTEFGERHRNADNPARYWASLLVFLIGFTGLLWSLPTPAEFAKISPLLNWGSAFLMVSVVYYFVISLPLGIGMIPFVWGIGALETWLSGHTIPLAYLSCILIGTGVTGFCLGHYAAGGLRAVLRDIQLVMIAPLWLLSSLYKRLGIPF